MPNLRIIYDNAADRATVTASTTSGGLIASNMQNDFKGSVHRSTGTSVTYTLTWTTGQAISAVVLPATNLSSSATIRVRLYSDTAKTNLIKDTGAKPATAAGYITAPTTVNRFAFGEYTKSSFWFTQVNSVRAAVIDVTDTGNSAGFIDCSRLILGTYWSPKYNFEPGAVKNIIDASSNTRAQNGDLRSYVSTSSEKLSFNFSLLPVEDYTALERIINYVGVTKPILLSLQPEEAAGIDASHMIYGKRSNSSTTYSVYKYYKSQLEIESW